ncbi:MAG: helix-turn-helix domain-containing protein [Acidobacteriota bacterium]|nr:MAG: helix-turn-helix domain-containing protein [Acidobacteriota bacterium]
MKAELESLIEQMIDHGILFDEAVREFEKKFIMTVVDRNHHNLSRAASELGIHRNTLSKRLVDYQKSDKVAPSRNGKKSKPAAKKRKS